MRKKILWTLQFMIMGVLLIYAIFSSQIFYDRLVADTAETLEKQIQSVDLSQTTISDEDAKMLSNTLFGRTVVLFRSDGSVVGKSNQEQIIVWEEAKIIKTVLAYGRGYEVEQTGKADQNDLVYGLKTEFADGEGIILVFTAVKTQAAMFQGTLPTLIWFILLVFLLTSVATYFGTEFIISPVKRIAKNAALSMKVDTKYAELKPIVVLLNQRNEEIGRQMRELSEEKELVVRAQASKNDFIANITHEMNTPLTSIRGYAELIQNGVLDEEQTKQAAEIMVKQSERLTKLIARIINYNELDNDDLPSYEVDMSKIATETLETLAPSLTKKLITLTKEIEEGVIVWSRQERVNELLGNLLRNSIRYNKEGGSLFVGLKRTEKGARLTISDTGIGIAEENLERIFDRFFTVDKSHNGQGGGFGLGLAVVKKICKRAGWVINVESKLGEGTTFTVDLKRGN